MSLPPYPEPPPTFLLTPSLWVVPEHQLWVPCFMHRTCSGHLFYIWWYTWFSVILSNRPTLALSHRVQKTVQKTVFLLLSHIQDYCYHLSKFNIYALVYFIGVYLSDLLHSVSSKPQWGTITRQSGWLLSKSLQAINAGEGVEKREPSYTVRGNAN